MRRLHPLLRAKLRIAPRHTAELNEGIPCFESFDILILHVSVI